VQHEAKVPISPRTLERVGASHYIFEQPRQEGTGGITKWPCQDKSGEVPAWPRSDDSRLLSEMLDVIGRSYELHNPLSPPYLKGETRR